jgi:hypothetical protein
MGTAGLLFAAALVRDPENRAPPASAQQQQVQRAARVLVDGMAMISAEGGTPLPPTPRAAAEVEFIDRTPLGAAFGCGGAVLIGASIALVAVLLKNSWQPIELAVTPVPPSPDLWLFVIGANVFWIVQAVRRQPGQWRRTYFVEQLQAGPLADVLRALAGHERSDFPPHWDPPGVLARQPYLPRFLDAIEIVCAWPEGSWVRSAFLARFERTFSAWLDEGAMWLYQDNRATPEQLRDLERVRDLLASLPGSPGVLAEHREYLIKLLEFTKEHDPPRSAIVEQILTLAAADESSADESSADESSADEENERG